MSTRRQLLGATGVLVASSGCAGVFGDDDSTVEASTSGAVRLEELSVQNNHGQSHRVQLAVEADDEILHLGTYDLEAADAATVEGEWNEAAASYRVHARLDDGSVRTADVTEGVGEATDCVRVLVRIDDADGRLEIWSSEDCDPDDGDL